MTRFRREFFILQSISQSKVPKGSIPKGSKPKGLAAKGCKLCSEECNQRTEVHHQTFEKSELKLRKQTVSEWPFGEREREREKEKIKMVLSNFERLKFKLLTH